MSVSSYRPRPNDSARQRMLDNHAKAIARSGHGLAHRRTNTVRRFPHCRHEGASTTVVEVNNPHGIWFVAICGDCGQLASEPQCSHVSNSWNEEGSLLTCDNCGIDGT